MFAPRHFAPRHFAPRHFPPGSTIISTDDDFQGTWDKFWEQQQQQIMREDEELIIIARAFIEIISCRH
jgi:hypothetical protein